MSTGLFTLIASHAFLKIFSISFFLEVKIRASHLYKNIVTSHWHEIYLKLNAPIFVTFLMIDSIKKQSFQPNFFSLFINPFYFIRKGLYHAVKQEASKLKGRLLDFGCGRKPYENLFTVSEYIGIDVKYAGHDHKLSKVDVFYDGKSIPFADSYFDSVFCGEVMEHIFTPSETLLEIKRVLRKGGYILLTVPFCWNEHEVPFDYARYTSYGITSLLEVHGFKVINLNKSGSFARTLFQLCGLYFFELFKKYGKKGYILSLIFILPLNIIGSILLPILPKNQSLYFNNIVLAEKL
jgi:SAM-dependent methyltransferase